MKMNFSLLFYLKKQKIYESGSKPIYMRITVNGKRVEVSAGRDCEPSVWNSHAGRGIGSKSEIRALNGYLDTLQAKVFNAHQQLIAAGEDVSADRLRDQFIGRSEKTNFIVELFNEHKTPKISGFFVKKYPINALKNIAFSI